MTTPRISRRALIRGAGGAAVALPFLEAMERPWRGRALRSAAAAVGATPAGYPKRVIFLFTPGGDALRWRPTGVETSFALPAPLAPLEPHKDSLILLDDVDNEAGHQSKEHRADGSGHASSGTVFTGRKLMAGGPYDDGDGYRISIQGPTVDQMLGERLQAGTKHKLLTLRIASDGFDREPSMLSYVSWIALNKWAALNGSPADVWQKLFADGPVATAGAPAPVTGPDPALLKVQRLRQSVLDVTREGFGELRAKLGASDRQRLDAHTAALRSIEMDIAALSQTTTRAMAARSCTTPAAPKLPAPQPEDQTPALSHTMLDLTAMALACDLTRVVTIQWSRCSSRNRFSWLSLGRNGWYHDWQHARDFETLGRVRGWYAGEVAYLIRALKALPEGAGTVFDNTVIVWANELGDTAAHLERGQGWVLAGSCGGVFRTGRYLRLRAPASYHNNILLSIVNAMGLPDTTFGDPAFCTGPLGVLR